MSKTEEILEKQSVTEANEVDTTDIADAADTTDTEDTTDTPYVHTEDNLEIRKMKFSQRIKAKQARLKENMEGMTTWEKTKYILYYYKGTIFWSIVILFIAIALPITIYNKTRPVAISYAVINCQNDENINTHLFEEYKDYYGFAESDQIQVNKAVFLNSEDYNENTVHNYSQSDYSQFPMLCHNDYFDVVFTDETGLEFCTTQAVVQPLDSRLPSDLYDIIKTEYSHLIVKSPNYNGDMVEYALDISDTEFAKELGLSYDKVLICFPGTSERNFTNSKKMLDYILKLNLAF